MGEQMIHIRRSMSCGALDACHVEEARRICSCGGRIGPLREAAWNGANGRP
jgi:hypothetical protein